ncbi:MAG: hypothetical protein EXR95_04280, partial [Gemmatimonadetes bacterium]|nr:hypothetical protein [Gemmatimonadota bacterium]
MLAAVGLGLATWTWRTWTDPIVDFGRDLYVPWRITEGDRLYRGLAYFNGPLSPYFNAGLFRAFGVSIGTLIGANLVLLGAVLGLLVSLLRRAAGWLCALVGTLAFLACCAFWQNVFVANFNWVTPYSHEATHGVILGLASLWALARWRDDGRRRWLIASGCAVGLAFLTKPEAFVAAAGASAIALLAASRRSGDPARAIGWWIGSALVPPALALLLLASGIGLGAAARGLLAAYQSALRGDVVGNPFYRRVAGLEDPAGNGLRMVRYVGVGLALLAPAAAIAWLGTAWPRRWATAAALATTILVAALAVRLSLWLDAGRVLPLALLAIAAVSLRPSLRGGSERADAALPLAVFGLLLLAKTILNSSMRHYGFALAAPGLALTAAVLAGPVPGWVDRRGWSGPALRAGALTIVAATMLSYLVGTGLFIASKPVTVAAGADRFRANDRRRVVGDALRWLEANGGPPGARRTVAIMPEG